MGNVQIEANGVMVDLRSKEDLIEVIDGMNQDVVNRLKSGNVKTNQKKRAEKATLSFFGSIAHYLKGGSE